MSSFLVSSYNRFNILAHSPKGKEIKNQGFTYLNYDNSFNKIIIDKKIIINDNIKFNPSFLLKHPKLNLIYNCPESIHEGYIETFKYKIINNKIYLKYLNRVNANGTSSCFLTFDTKLENILVTNYWTSSISIHPLINGIPQQSIFTYYNNNKLKIKNINDHLSNRQNESHNHSLYFLKENLIIVPDLGDDTLKFFKYYNNELDLTYSYKLIKSSGPRYLQIKDNYIYIINELDSSITVLKIFTKNISFINKNNKIIFNNKFNVIHKIEELQTIKTIPNNFNDINTCGNIILYKNFIFASNRGHNSIAMFSILNDNQLKLINIFNCLGKTPRHFNINNNKLIVANQDSNNIVIFNIHPDKLVFNKIINNVNSPNYIFNLSL